jgi:hypothetical protein
MADQINSQFVTDDELTVFINKGYAKVYDKMIQAYGTNYSGVINPLLIPGVPNQAFYPLPDGVLYVDPNTMLPAPPFYKMLGVDLNLTGNLSDTANWYTIWPFNMGQRNRGSVVPRLNNVNRPVDYRYRIQANSLWLSPVPNGGEWARLWYQPSVVELALPGDMVVNLQPGWEELVEIYAAIMMKLKGEEDVTDMKGNFANALVDLKDAIGPRDVGAPFTIVDVYEAGSGLGDGYGDDAFQGGYW